ncbi:MULTISPECIES: hypothetical protein [unclassified Acidovorax]|uniref:hypothetical protein n=1 Tax=unclassified Acidovorax TaxID=2684926 RepID=UPI000C3C0F2B|nr:MULTISPECIES: hypothetical protein [unclassified Acidovorax]PIF16751.1 hypothetical protein CLU87_0655 [Acidovorax sp. 59]PKW04225.1 hypothetical protein CLU89_3906 [Acidovorax sp. 30]
MSRPSTAPANDPTETEFFEALMAQLMQGSMIPKVQVERSIGPILGFFLAEALSAALDEDLVSLCPEFPIRKMRLDESGNNQSTNIDWLMFSRSKNDLLLVELKTTDTSFREEQSDIYRRLQDTIAERNSAAFLIEELQSIASASQEAGKYKTVTTMLEQALRVPEGGLPQALGEVRNARIIYIAPEVSKPSAWLDKDPAMLWFSFGDLPESIEHRFANHWPAVRQSLVSLDTLSRRIRNGAVQRVDQGKNYRFLLSLDELLEQCRKDSGAIVVGLMNWRLALPTMTADQLRAKTYKCDFAQGGIGKKLDKNWIPGDQFLAQAIKMLDVNHVDSR